MIDRVETWMALNEHTPAVRVDPHQSARSVSRGGDCTRWAAVVVDGREYALYVAGRMVPPKGIHWPIHPEAITRREHI